uniref:Uncharacterized protein n=1 Tax=Romanomermis culicivorax TaxID=13658 RepID=A0A915JB74_ROMCU
MLPCISITQFFRRFLAKKCCFAYVRVFAETHNQPLYGVAISPYVRNCTVMATVGHNRCTIYKLGEASIDLLFCFSDGKEDENFYCCSWLYEKNLGDHLVAVAGKRGVIHIISPKSRISLKELKGHGNAVNDLAIHPQKPDLLLSAGKDHTLRLWNFVTNVCVAMFNGVKGHCDEVLSCDFDLTGRNIASSGIDHMIKIWNIETNEKLQNAIESAEQYYENNKAFKTLKIDFPDFSTKDIHTNYVDCIKWLGDLILSKSCENIVSLWKPGDLTSLQFSKNETDVTKIRDYALKHCNIQIVGPKILYNAKCNALIRQIAFNVEGTILVAVCENATIWRWDLTS